MFFVKMSVISFLKIYATAFFLHSKIIFTVKLCVRVYTMDDLCRLWINVKWILVNFYREMLTQPFLKHFWAHLTEFTIFISVHNLIFSKRHILIWFEFLENPQWIKICVLLKNIFFPQQWFFNLNSKLTPIYQNK
jgi:hypothetical protein